MIYNSCCHNLIAVNNAAYFVMYNLYLSRQLVGLMLKIVMNNGRNIMEIVPVYICVCSSEC
jgi:hypothetical protein